MRKDYYIVDGGPVLASIEAHLAKAEPLSHQMEEFAKEVGGVRPICTSVFDHNGYKIIAIVFEGALPSGWKKSKLVEVEKGSGLSAGLPGQNTKEGKALAERMSQFGIPLSREIFKHFNEGAYRELYYDHKVCWPGCGKTGEAWTIMLPNKDYLAPLPAPEGCRFIDSWVFHQMAIKAEEGK